jgi:hypothetical protein
MLTQDDQLQLIGYAEDRARAYRLASKLLDQAAGELLGRRYRPALDCLIEAEQLIGHDIVTPVERNALRDGV